MASVQILKLLALLILIVPFSGCYYILKRRKDLYPLLPGAALLVFSYITSYISSIAIVGETNFFTHLFLMLSGIFWLLGMVYVYFTDISKQESILIKKEIRK